MEFPDNTAPIPESTFGQEAFLRRWYALRERGEVGLTNLFAAPMTNASWDSCRRTGAWLGLLLFSAMKRRRMVAVHNLQLAFPGIAQRRALQIARRSAQNFGMTFCEFLHLNGASPQSIHDYVTVEGEEHLQAGLERGKGLILLTAHFGNWEALGARAAQMFPLTVVARPTSNPGVQSHLDRIRRGVNMELISSAQGARPALRALRQNKALAILPDQYAGPNGLVLPFFGHNTSVWPSVAHLAMMSGATVLPSFGVRQKPWMTNGRFIAKIFPGYQVSAGNDKNQIVREGTLRMIAELENIIHQHPEQWMWLHRRWRAADLGK